MSDAQLDTLRKIPCKLQLNPSSRLGGVVRTRFFDFDDLRTYLRTDGLIPIGVCRFGGDSEQTNKNKNHRHSTAL